MTPKQLAKEVKQWRRRLHIKAWGAAMLLHIPKRTLDGIEQGRGFRYEHMLLLAMRQLDTWTSTMMAEEWERQERANGNAS